MMMTQRCYSSSSRSNSYSNSMARRSFCHFLRQHGDNHHNHTHTRRSNNTVTVPSQRPTIYSCRPNTTTARTTTIRWFGDMSSSSSSSSIDRAFEGVSEEVSKRIQYHAHQPQTAVSLKTLLQTGRGEFLHKTYKNLEEEDNHRGATGKVLIQVSIIVWVLLLLLCVGTQQTVCVSRGLKTNFPYFVSLIQ